MVSVVSVRGSDFGPQCGTLPQRVLPAKTGHWPERYIVLVLRRSSRFSKQ
jgi:hypothetical protein